jgi:hypothetical protein
MVEKAATKRCWFGLNGQKQRGRAPLQLFLDVLMPNFKYG